MNSDEQEAKRSKVKCAEDRKLCSRCVQCGQTGLDSSFRFGSGGQVLTDLTHKKKNSMIYAVIWILCDN